MSVEKKIKAASGWGMLFAVIVAFVVIIAAFILSIVGLDSAEDAGVAASPIFAWGLGLSITAFCLIWIPVSGFFTLQPGQARVCILFGDYKGTVRDEGFRWANPFYSRSMGASSSSEEATAEVLSKSGLSLSKQISVASKSASGLSTKISVRARTLNGEILKVNDKVGNPIEIANVVVWHVADTAKALFDVDNYEQFVATQAETALRHVASIYAYDHAEDSSDSMESITLRSNIEEVSTALKYELTQRLAPAGITVDDARLTHLAYAPEIAQAMLRRQQAEAVIAARKKIVEGAVSMVEMAVEELSRGGQVELDEERKAAMASNLMVVLCGESEARPVVNTGSLY
ncbi:SPFH domain-containing protein [Enorma phocaeensis]|uniref:SPFH domain-containing protein n=1 Tax=Enorma phocaeensis TaxID=1871019 RepID=A0ABT7V8L3_9ACTN|nr:SPFH domain-containing protein [Enorma phocaeensis]MBM6953834.1 SPFH domain-containing protein [Enorma phocaeensis]MDM8274833.1 SPFH domain-containing protein [Enorma phocaeensis]